jgi:protein translocase SecG subunit
MINLIIKDFFRLVTSIPYNNKDIQSNSESVKLFAIILACAILSKMTRLIEILPYIQIVLSVLLVAAILIQKSEAGVGGSFGGSDNFNAGFHSRRGFELKLFYFTITIAILFVLSSLIIIFIK